MKRIFMGILLLMVLLASCGTKPQTDESLTATDIVETPILPTDAPVNVGLVYEVPTGELPIIDGVFSDGEWDDALHTSMSNGNDLYWLYADGYLYAGVQGLGLGAVNLAIVRDGQIWVLHSSAALGSKIYIAEGDGWEMIQDYNWCCRSTEFYDENNALFQAENWHANIGYLGEEGQVEYKIGVETNQATLALTYSGNRNTYWPDNLSGLSRIQIDNYEHSTVSFSFGEWATLVWE